MKHLGWVAVAVLGSCSFPEPKQTPSTGVAPARGPRTSSVVPAVFYRAGEFVYGRAVRLETIKLTHGPMMSLAVARLKNVAGLPYNLEYRFRFYDEGGAEVRTDDTSRWKPFEIKAGELETLNDVYPSESIVRAGIEIREIEN